MATTAKKALPVLGAALVTAAMVGAPTANAGMRVGNYEVLTDRWNDHAWIWSVAHSCGGPECATWINDPVLVPETDNLNVIGIPRPLKSQRIQNTAFYADGR